MLSSLFSKSVRKSKPIDTTCCLLLPVEDVCNGTLVRKSAFQVVDAARADNQFSSADFSIGNLLAIGAFNTMTKSCIVNTSRLNAADSFDNFNISDNVPEKS